MAGRIYPNEIKRLFTFPGGPIGKVCRRVALDIAQESKRIAEAELGKNPRDQARTGQYAKGFRVTVSTASNTFKFIVSNKKKYAASLEKGARPHLIRARRVQYLQFRGRSGQWGKVTVVSHRGNRPYRIMERATKNVVRALT